MNTASRSLLPNQPELIKLTSEEYLLHSSGRKQGQAEGLREAVSAVQQLRNHTTIDDAALASLQRQLDAQAIACAKEQNHGFAQWLVLHRGHSLVSRFFRWLATRW